MKGGKNWIFPKEINATRFSLDGNLEKHLCPSLYGTEWRERGYGLCPRTSAANVQFVLPAILMLFYCFSASVFDCLKGQ